jgi:hypothetical protein
MTPDTIFAYFSSDFKQGYFNIEKQETLDEIPFEYHLAPAEKEKCVWTESTDPDVSYWDSGCGQSFYFEEGTPEENGMKYCPFCGKEVSVPLPPKRSRE